MVHVHVVACIQWNLSKVDIFVTTAIGVRDMGASISQVGLGVPL